MNDFTDSACDTGSSRSACRRSAALCVIVAALAFASACMAVQSGRRLSAQLDRRADAADRDWTEAAAGVQSVDTLRKSQDAVVSRAQQAEMLLATSPGSQVLAEVSNALPSGVWLTDFNLESVETDSDALRVQLTGLASGDAEIRQYVEHLRDSKLLQDVTLTLSQRASYEGLPLREFGIELHVGGAEPFAPGSVPPTLTASIGH